MSKEFWKEYPERDLEYVRWYPVNFARIEDPEDIWRKREVGIYVHIPFCETICSYCPYNKYRYREDRAIAYVSALKQEIKNYAARPYLQESKITRIYFGGGTPTALPIEKLLEILELIFERFDVSSDAEISVEANPETLSWEKVVRMRESGVNRLSIGVQSFDPERLRLMGRGHTAEEAEQAIIWAKEAGYDVVSIDLMYWFPGETVDDWRVDLEKAISLKLDHYSCYYLVLSPGTKIFNQIQLKRIPPQPPVEVATEMYQLAIQMFTGAGYEQYSCSDFAKPGKYCLSHAQDWAAPQTEYVGFGAGAFSYLRGWHWCNIHNTKKYIEIVNSGRLPVMIGTKVSTREKMARFFVLGVKFLKVSKKDFEEIFGVSVDTIFKNEINILKQRGLIEEDEEWIYVTEKGKIYIDNISKTFYTPECKMKPQPIAVELAAGKGASLTGIKGI